MRWDGRPRLPGRLHQGGRHPIARLTGASQGERDTHEVAHIKERDILGSTVGVAIAGAITGLARIVRVAAPFHRHDDDERHGLRGDLVLVLVAPLAAVLLQLVIARRRE